MSSSPQVPSPNGGLSRLILHKVRDVEEEITNGRFIMCRSIKTLFNFSPPASDEEVFAASLQFVRKISGFKTPSKANQAAFDRATHEIARASRSLIKSLTTTAVPRNRAEVAAAAHARWERSQRKA
jgi:hypothetical protein